MSPWKILMLQERKFRRLRGLKKMRKVYCGADFKNNEVDSDDQIAA